MKARDAGALRNILDAAKKQEEAATRVRGVFHVILKLSIIGMIPRKRVSGPDDVRGTIYEQEEPKDELGFNFLAGKKLWDVCGRGVEY
ncbi:unnamed protein product, partial [marine sediment metagenome]